MKRIKNKRELAWAIKATVLEDKHYDQGRWLSMSYFPNDTVRATGSELREKFGNVCGTTGCVAGNAVVFTIPSKAKYDWHSDKVVFDDGTSRYVQDYAREVLGLTHDEADWLFSAHRSVEQVLKAMDKIIDDEPVSDLF